MRTAALYGFDTPPPVGGDWGAAYTAHKLFGQAVSEAALNDPDQDLWVGLIDEAAVGYAVARAEVLRTGEILGIVSDLWVEPAAREVGVGEALINEIIGWCKERGCIGIDSRPGSDWRTFVGEQFHHLVLNDLDRTRVVRMQPRHTFLTTADCFIR